MDNYPSNSHSQKQPAKAAKKVEKVIQGEATMRKKPLGKKFAETFIKGNPRDAWATAFWEDWIPALKEAAVHSFFEGVERTVFGDARGRTRRMAQGMNQQVAYNRYSSSGTPAMKPDPRMTAPSLSKRAKETHDFGEIELTNRASALDVIEKLYDIVNQYEQATVKDLYDLVGFQSDYTDQKWGWTNMQGSEPVRTREGTYVLSLPRPEPLD